MTLEQALIRYDLLQSTKRHYNRYGLGIYLIRADEVMTEVKNGASLKDAISNGFNDRLRDYLLKHVDGVNQ